MVDEMRVVREGCVFLILLWDVTQKTLVRLT
jgi:hypothetical protein